MSTLPSKESTELLDLGCAPISMLPGKSALDARLYGLHKSKTGRSLSPLFGTSPHVNYWVDPHSPTMKELLALPPSGLSKKAYAIIHAWNNEHNLPTTTIENYSIL